MNRKEAREFVMQVVFHMEIHKDFAPEALIKFPKFETMANQKEYVQTLIEQLCENIEEIDETLNKNSVGWPVTRMPKSDLAIARVATCEIKYMPNIPKAVAINEAVELAKKYEEPETVPFINGVLGSFIKGEI